MLKSLLSPTRFIPVILYFLLTATFIQAQDDIDCSDCHEVEIKGIHFDAVECIDCHSDIEDEDHEDIGVAKVNCLDCHDEYEASVKNDIHHKIKKKIKGKPTCKSCHGKHTIIAPSKYKNRSKQYCEKCHTDGKVVLVASYHTSSIKETACFECHEEEDYKPDLSTSVHTPLSCIDCHSYVSRNLDEHEDGLALGNKANCYSCHNDIAKQHSKSIHGITIAEGEEDAAMCWNCHGSHHILTSTDSTSTTNPKNIGSTCGTCHDDPEFENKFNMSVKLPGKMYSQSVHGKLVMLGDKEAANCTSCHGSHTIKNRVLEGSQIASVNIPNTCGECHREITEEYKKSIHWMRAKKGIKEAPVCNDCHNEHSIEEVKSENKKAYRLKMQDKTCISCHNNKGMNQKFGNSGNEVSQYLKSYHGLASYRGGNNAALCVDCHGVHNILPKKYDESMVSDSNVTETCRQCHKNASERFSISYSHETISEEAKFVEDVVREVYFWLIIVVIGGMMLHNMIIFWYELRRKKIGRAHV